MRGASVFACAGKIVERVVNVGDRVEVGQVIARLDETDLKLAETSAQGRGGRGAQPSRCGKRQPGARQAPAAQSDHLAGEPTTPDAMSWMRPSAALESAEAQLRQAVNAVDYATLKADKAGSSPSVTGEPGQVVSAGQAVIALGRAGETEIAVAVPEQDAARLAIGQPAKYRALGGSRPRASRAHSRDCRAGRPRLAHLCGPHCR